MAKLDNINLETLEAAVDTFAALDKVGAWADELRELRCAVEYIRAQKRDRWRRRSRASKLQHLNRQLLRDVLSRVRVRK